MAGLIPTLTPEIHIECVTCEARNALAHNPNQGLWFSYADLIENYCFIDRGELVLNELALLDKIHTATAVAGCSSHSIVVTDEQYSLNITGDTTELINDALLTYDELDYPATDYPLLRVWIASSTLTVNPRNDMPVVAEFYERLFGTFDSTLDFVQYLEDDPGYPDKIPDWFILDNFAAVTTAPEDPHELSDTEFLKASSPIAVFHRL